MTGIYTIEAARAEHERREDDAILKRGGDVFTKRAQERLTRIITGARQQDAETYAAIMQGVDGALQLAEMALKGKG